MNYTVKNIYGKTSAARVQVGVPGSKSITARAMLLAAIAEGESTLFGAQLSDDCRTFLKCLGDLGIKSRTNGSTVKIEGCGGRLSVKSGEINVGSAGTAARFITAFLAFQSGKFRVNCSEQMKSRPIAPLIRTLESLGAEFEFGDRRYAFPFTVKGTVTPAKSVRVDITESSQFLSALLISAACAKSGLKIETTGTHGKGYVNMTLDMMWSFGLSAEVSGDTYFVKGGYTAKRYDVEPDVSAACYFYAVNKILGTDIRVNGVMPHTVQADYKFIEMLKDFDGGRVDMSGFSDQTLTLAAIAPYLKNPTEICGVAHIRRQECDRIAAIVYNLSAMGVKCEEREDGVIIYPSKPKPAKIETFGDHRVAMSFALTGLRADGIEIENAQVCSKTFPDYFEVLDKLCDKLSV